MEDEGTDPYTEKINVDIKTSVIKPIHARWLIAAIEEITRKQTVLSRALYKQA